MRNRRAPIYSAVAFVGLIFVLMSMPKHLAEKTRGLAMSIAAPSFQSVYKIAGYFKKSGDGSGSQSSLSRQSSEELERLRSENIILSMLLKQNRELLENEIQLSYYIEMLEKNDDEALDWLKYQAEHRHINLKSFVETKVQSVPARIIFRSPATWNSSVWVDVGSDNNLGPGGEIIQKNSPVLSGDSIVGVVDYVGKRQSRIKLITDSGVTPSVRAVRKEEGKILYLAKGELHGASSPLWREKSSILEGIGFNYDFADEEGPARDLRSGEPHDDSKGGAPIPIIKVNDLLVTTGMDGVFPPGFR